MEFSLEELQFISNILQQITVQANNSEAVQILTKVQQVLAKTNHLITQQNELMSLPPASSPTPDSATEK
jgi:hypothetical protein